MYMWCISYVQNELNEEKLDKLFCFPFGALTLLVALQKGHLTYKKILHQQPAKFLNNNNNNNVATLSIKVFDGIYIQSHSQRLQIMPS